MCDHIHYDALEKRVDNLEKIVADMRKETNDGLRALNANIETVSQQTVALQKTMTNMDTRLVEEKSKWGDVFRSIVKWTVRTGLCIIAYAAGLNITKSIIQMWN